MSEQTARQKSIAKAFGTPEPESVDSSPEEAVEPTVSMSNTKAEILDALAEAGVVSVPTSATKSELLDLLGE